MTIKYFKLLDVDTPGRWHLSGVTDQMGRRLDSRDFTYGLLVETDTSPTVHLYNSTSVVEAALPLTVSKRYVGSPLDFTFAGFSVPVVTTQVADILAKVAGGEFQRFPARVASESAEYEIINFTSRVACLDRQFSKVMWWTEEDGRPDKVGKPRMISKLVIDPSKIGESQIFRLHEWIIALIVSERVREALERANVSGVEFGAV